MPSAPATGPVASQAMMRPMPERLTIVLPPAPSVNALSCPRRGGGIGYTALASKWKKNARTMCIVQAYQQGWEPLDTWTRVVFKAYWPDRRTHDCSNLHKAVLDVLTTVAYSDDRWALTHDDVPEVDTKNPRLELTIFLEVGYEHLTATSQRASRVPRR